jgi:hypothetical protein
MICRSFWTWQNKASMRVRESSRGYWFQILPLKSFLHPILRMPPAFFGVLLSHDLIPMHVAARSAAAEFNHAAFQNGQSIAAERHCRATKSPKTNCQWPMLAKYPYIWRKIRRIRGFWGNVRKNLLAGTERPKVFLGAKALSIMERMFRWRPI